MTLAAQTPVHLFPAALPASALQIETDPIAVEIERVGDEDAREALLDRAFGPERFRKTCERIRAGRLPAHGLALVARLRTGDGSGEIVGTVRLWHVNAGGVPALMLGPLAVNARWRSHGLGARLVRKALDRSRAIGYSAVLLVGDAPYYARFGFERRNTLRLRMPGPVESDRFLGLNLLPGALDAAAGMVKATGAIDLAAKRGHTHRAELPTAA